MLSKMAIEVFLSLVMGIALSLSVTAADNDLAGEPVVRDINFWEAQFERWDRLTELFDGNFLVPFSADGEPVNAPSINFLIPPMRERDYFIIGLEDIPTQECIDFILLYTGIPPELAYVTQAITTRRIRRGYHEAHEYNDSTADCIDSQFELLTELLVGRFVMSFSDDGERVNAPRLNMIAPPEGGRRYFIIGMEDEETEECIDFVLYYTGIPRERASIGKAYYFCEGGTWIYPDDYEHNEFTLYQDEHTENLYEIAPLSALAIGSRIRINHPTNGTFMHRTLGHPLNSQINSFATAPHTTAVQNFNVSTYPFNRHIGSVGHVWYEPRRDVAIVYLQGHTVHPFVDGGQINNFRAAAGIDNPVVSARGVSGLQRDMHVHSINFQVPGSTFVYTNRISVYPNRTSQDGDSGAALIRRLAPTDRAVLGTRTGRATLVSGHVVGLYTSVLNY